MKVETKYFSIKKKLNCLKKYTVFKIYVAQINIYSIIYIKQIISNKLKILITSGPPYKDPGF